MVRKTITLEETIENAINIMARLDNVNFSEKIRQILLKEIGVREKELEEEVE